MNNSKTFLGLTAFLLTIVGGYASKKAAGSFKLLGCMRGGSSCNYVRQFSQVVRAGPSDAGVAVKTNNKTVFTRCMRPSCGAVIYEASVD